MVKKDPEKWNIEYAKSQHIFKTVKTSLTSIIRNNHHIKMINNIVINMNKIIIHTYNFLKLFYIHQFDTYYNLACQRSKVPIIDEKLINSIMKIMCIKDNRGTHSS